MQNTIVSIKEKNILVKNTVEIKKEKKEGIGRIHFHQESKNKVFFLILGKLAESCKSLLYAHVALPLQEPLIALGPLLFLWH